MQEGCCDNYLYERNSGIGALYELAGQRAAHEEARQYTVNASPLYDARAAKGEVTTTQRGITDYTTTSTFTAATTTQADRRATDAVMGRHPALARRMLGGDIHVPVAAQRAEQARMAKYAPR